MVRAMERPCDCGTAIRCADLGGPLVYDPIYNELQLVMRERRFRLLYCFNCGGRLPDSMRGRRFTTPSAQECEQIARILHRCRSAEDVLRELGPSDVTDE